MRPNNQGATSEPAKPMTVVIPVAGPTSCGFLTISGIYPIMAGKKNMLKNPATTTMPKTSVIPGTIPVSAATAVMISREPTRTRYLPQRAVAPAPSGLPMNWAAPNPATR